MDASRFQTAGRGRPLALVALLMMTIAGTAHAVGPDAVAEPPAEVAADLQRAPWLTPIDDTRPIRRVSALRTEYRRIRELRREQMQPEFERRVAQSGEEAADAWRRDTLREIAKRDLRDLRERLER
ncbi:hypothetical protein CMZ84_14985 [Lysobacteraceae bacterium NML93-0399]|nr:hypothetical protein CMZ84_14985 [Xanthomonadaceae bacterium NML93-0399]